MKAGDFIQPMNEQVIQTIRNGILELNSITGQMSLTSVELILLATDAKYAICGVFSGIEPTLGHKTSVNTFIK